MTSILRCFSMAVLFLALLSCTSLEGPEYNESFESVSPSKSLVIVFRKVSLAGAPWHAPFFVDKKMFTILENGGFGVVEIEPGKHTISYGPESYNGGMQESEL